MFLIGPVLNPEGITLRGPQAESPMQSCFSPFRRPRGICLLPFSSLLTPETVPVKLPVLRAFPCLGQRLPQWLISRLEDDSQKAECVDGVSHVSSWQHRTPASQGATITAFDEDRMHGIPTEGPRCDRAETMVLVTAPV